VSGNAAALSSFADAARERITQRLPSASKLSPNAVPRDRARETRGNRGALIALLVGCAFMTLIVIIGLSWSLHSSVQSTIQAMPTKAAPAGSAGH
jgi:type VI protein secretion system component VasF